MCKVRVHVVHMHHDPRPGRVVGGGRTQVMLLRRPVQPYRGPAGADLAVDHTPVGIAVQTA